MHRDIPDRYFEMIAREGCHVSECVPEPGTDLRHLNWMLDELRSGRITGDKANRWLGFIQGCLISRGLTDVTTERNFTRPYFT